MIRVSILVDSQGCLRRLEAEGHSLIAGEGFSPGCAAASALLRTAAELISAEEGVESRVLLPEEGRIRIEAGPIPEAKTERLRGITDFLAYGLMRLERESPESLRLVVTE